MGYLSEVGYRVVVPRRNALSFYRLLMTALKQEYNIEDSEMLYLRDRDVRTLQDASDVSSEFYFKIGEHPSDLYADVYSHILSTFTPDTDYFIVEYKNDSVKWYPNFALVQFWESLTHSDNDLISEWAYCRIGEDIGDIEYADSNDLYVISPLLPTSTIDWEY